MASPSTRRPAALALRPLSFVVLLGLTWLASGCAGRDPAPSVADAYAPATAGAASVGVVYLELTNGDRADTLIGAHAPNARAAEIHGTTMEQGMMRMRPVPALPLGRREHVRFEPGGLHVMLLDLAGPLRPGDEFTLVLEFERAGPIEVRVEVRALA